MNTKISSVAILALLFVLLIVGQVEVTKAVTCNPLQLSACAVAITSPRPPSSMCCAKLKEQRPCLCKYLKTPSLQKFIKSDGAKRVARSCRATYPKCS